MSKSTSVKGRGLGPVGVFFLAVFLSLGWMTTGLAEEAEIDLNAFIQETQKMSQKTDDMTFVWWVPIEYWRTCFAQDPSVSETQAQEFIKILSPYTLLLVGDGKVGPLGGVTYRTEADIRAIVKIRDSEGDTYPPLSTDMVDPDTKNFLSMIKPVFVNILGPMGQNIHFLVFPSENKKGHIIAEPRGEGSFAVELGNKEFKWRLPLGSLLPPKICPTCKEELSGAYKFCHWDGAKLP